MADSPANLLSTACELFLFTWQQIEPMGKLKKTTLGAVAAAPFDPSGAALVLAVGSGVTLITRSAWRKVTGSGPETVGNLVSDFEESTSFKF